MLDRVLFVFVALALAWHFWDRSLDKGPWPDYAAPMACSDEGAGPKYEGPGLRMRYPNGWKAVENTAPGSQSVRSNGA